MMVVGPSSGGISRHVLGLLSRLDRAAYRPLLVCDPESRLYQDARQLGIEAAGLSIPGGVRPLRALQSAGWMADLLRRSGASLVHAHGFSAGVVSALARRRSRLPVKLVCTIHNLAPAGTSARMGEALVIGSANLIIFVSESLRSGYRLNGSARSKAMVIPNGLDLEEFRQLGRAEARRVLGLADQPVAGMVGRLAPQKGVLELVRAASLASRVRPGLTFLVIGEGPLMKPAVELGRELGLGDAIRFLGRRERAGELMLAFDLVVIPSLSEGSSLVAMEAMAAGRPIIASRVGGLAEVVGEAGVLVPPGDPEALAEAICQLLSDPGRGRVLAQAGRRRVEQCFDLRSMVERTEQAYRELVEEVA